MARFTVSLEVDVESFQRVIDREIAVDVQAAMVEGLNAAGEAGVRAVRKGMVTAFDRPNPFTLAGVTFYRATARTDGGDPSVLIYIWDQTALYLDVHVEGGVRRAGDPFTTRRGPIVPGPAAPRDQFGNLPHGFTEQAMTEPNVEWITATPGRPPILIRRLPGGKLEVLAIIVEEVKFETPRFDFYGLAAGGAVRAFPPGYCPL